MENWCSAVDVWQDEVQDNRIIIYQGFQINCVQGRVLEEREDRETEEGLSFFELIDLIHLFCSISFVPFQNLENTEYLNLKLNLKLRDLNLL